MLLTHDPLSEKVFINENAPVEDKVEGRIVGGEKVPEDEENFSYQVQIVTKYHEFCSGCIIDEYHILTAAFCVYNVKVQDMQVRADSLTRGAGMLVPIASIAIPDEYDPLELDMDVAVLRTVRPFKFRIDFFPIPILDAESDLPDSVVVSGWGKKYWDDFEISDQLMFVNVPLVNNMFCQSHYILNEVITKNMFCTGTHRTGVQGTCQGDRGGPATDRYYYKKLVGINISYKGCGRNNIPSVFTSVLAKDIRKFINDNIKYKGNSFGDHQFGGYDSSAGNHSGDYYDGGKHDVCSCNQNGGDNDSDNYDGGNPNGNYGCKQDSGNHNSDNNFGCRQKGGTDGGDHDSGNHNGDNYDGVNTYGSDNDGSFDDIGNHDGDNYDGDNHNGGDPDRYNDHKYH
ncbi:jg10822 [Pararge aegeria aegeria]|uniref:Jg10822 protein n=1 Tax=Pararge aegeria aegeria TaxID=348720 RepID=A0A8S4QGG9_9NEOP|nr:jg10822 [Pararge aegeria aegeria]